MTYTPATLSVGMTLIGGAYRVWVYKNADPFSTMDDTDYFLDAYNAGMREGDFIFCIESDTDPPNVTLAYVSAIDTDGNATVSAAAVGSAPTLTSATIGDLTVTGTALIGDAAADLLGFHGETGVSQRAGSNQVTTNIVTSASFGTLQVAHMQEIMNTLDLLGLWKGAA